MSDRIDIDLDYAAIERMRGWDGDIGRAVMRLAKGIAYRQEEAAGVYSGAMRNAIEVGRPGRWGRGIEIHVGANPSQSATGYAFWNNEGTKPHQILPKATGGLLVFFWPKVGRTVFLRGVKHPGNRAYRWAQRGLDKAARTWTR